MGATGRSGVMARKGISIPRLFCPGDDPYSLFKWVRKNVDAKDKDGKPVTSHEGVEVPDFWSDSAAFILSDKYFRAAHGSCPREISLKQTLDRVVNEIVKWGVEHGYFDKANGAVFGNELRVMIASQRFSFNSPVYFNVGCMDKPQCAACFILVVYDDLGSISAMVPVIVHVFSHGSGCGFNLSLLREMGAPLSRGGVASGPKSFLLGYNSFAGIIKSGGIQRRAAMLARLDDTHPDVLDFIEMKSVEERKARALVRKGYTVEEAYKTVAFQNVNLSIGISDALMKAALEGKDWVLKSVLTGKTVKVIKAMDLLDMIAHGAHFCGDPGIQLDDTMNRGNPLIRVSKILSTNPCVVGSTNVYVKEGKKTVLKRVDRIKEGSAKILSYDFEKRKPVFAKATFLGKTRQNAKVVKLKTAKGEIRLTPDHEVMTSRGWIKAADIQKGDKIYRVKVIGGVSGEFGDSQTYPGRTSQVVVPDGNVEEIEVLGMEECEEGEDVYDFSVPKHHAFFTEEALVSNCAEFVCIPNTACNLASMNLAMFYRDGAFQHEEFRHAVRISIVAQDILVGLSGYPTPEIDKNSNEYRPLGLGFTNLGGMFIKMGIPYDSDQARMLASAVSADMTATAYQASVDIAKVLGPFSGFEYNRKAMLAVLKAHKNKFNALADAHSGAADLDGISDEWEKVCQEAVKHGIRNCQVTLVPPAGTISNILDCTTAGIEPILFSATKRRLDAGGELIVPSFEIDRGLEGLGYSKEERAIITKYIESNGTLSGAPVVKPQHLPVFDPVYPLKVGDRRVSAMAQIQMMGAVQPFISGSISKTIGLPESASVEEVKETIIQAWKLGLKAISFYRSNSKMSQPLVNAILEQEKMEEEEGGPARRVMPQEVRAHIHRGVVGPGSTSETKLYIIPGEREDGTLGEVFVTLAKEGSALRGLVDALMTAVSIGLQYGVPLEVFCKKFIGTKFEPMGWTRNEKIKFATSLVDYIFKYLGSRYLGMSFEAPKAIDEDAPKEPSKSDEELRRAVIRALRHPTQYNTFDLCDCGGMLYMEGPCKKCSNKLCKRNTESGGCGG